MSIFTHRYCPRCDAANPLYGDVCFACGVSLKATRPLTSETADSAGHIVLHQLFKGRYYILSQVGAGGFGAVYKAEDTRENNRLVAIKEIRLSGLTPQQVIDATDAFNREVSLLSGLKHPNIPRIYEHFTEPEEWYLVMDFIEGETLEAYRAKMPDNKLPVEQALAIGIQLCTTLDYLHTQQPPIIYRDLKPANIMLTADGHLYLIDFGVARRFKPGKSRDTIAFGSPGYAAPEQYGKTQTTPQSDLYSLSATLHNLLTGLDPEQSPFHFPPLHLPQAFAGLEALIMQMVDAEISRRPASAVAVKQELQQIAGRQKFWYALSPAPGTIKSLIPPLQATSTFSTRGVTLYIHRGHLAAVQALSWSPDGKHIASASDDRTVQEWQALTGNDLFIYFNHFDVVNDVVWSPDGRHIASASADHSVQIWDATSRPLWLRALALRMGFKFTTYESHPRAVSAIAWMPDGQRLVSGSEDNMVHVWDASTRETLFVYHGHTDVVNAVAGSSDGRYIATSSIDHTLRIWNIQTGEGIFIFRRPSCIVTALAWSPDSKCIAFGTSDHRVEIWDIAARSRVSTYRGHTDGIRAVSWSPDGAYIASASRDQTVRIWDTTTEQHTYTYESHSGVVTDVAWSPDGRYIASGGNDKTVHVWQAN